MKKKLQYDFVIATTLLLHYQQMGWLTDNLLITCSSSLPGVHK